MQHLATISRRTGLAFPVKAQLDATDVLTRAAVFMHDTRLSPHDFFRRFDEHNVGKLSRRAVATLIRVVMKAAGKEQTARLAAEFLQAFDHDCDGLISVQVCANMSCFAAAMAHYRCRVQRRAVPVRCHGLRLNTRALQEFDAALAQGEPALPTLEGSWGAIDLRSDFADGQVLTSNSLERLSAEHAVLRDAERAGAPLSQLLQQVSSLTGGRSRKLDMGSAKAAAQHVDPATVAELRDGLAAELRLCRDFEAAYAARLNVEFSGGAACKGGERAASGATADGGGGGGAPLATAVQAANRAHFEAKRDAAVAAAARRRRADGPPGLDVSSNASGWAPPRPASRIPQIPARSHLLADTSARMHYMVASVEQNAQLAAMANDVSARSCGYPASGPGALKPVATGWDRRRRKFEQGGAGRRTCVLFRTVERTGSDRSPPRHVDAADTWLGDSGSWGELESGGAAKPAVPKRPASARPPRPPGHLGVTWRQTSGQDDVDAAAVGAPVHGLSADYHVHNSQPSSPVAVESAGSHAPPSHGSLMASLASLGL